MKFVDIRLKPKIFIGLLAPLIFLVVLAAVSITRIQDMLETEEWVEHTNEVLREAQLILASATDIETGMRGYLLAGQDEFLEPYRAGQAATYGALAALRVTVSDNPGQVARLEEAEQILRDWQREVTEPSIALRQQIGDGVTLQEISDLVAEARGKAFFDRFRGVMAAAIAEEESLMIVRVADNLAAAEFTDTIIWSGLFVAVLAVAGLAWFIGNGIANPITQMTGAMRQLASGEEKDVEILGIGREDEVGEMAEALQVFREAEEKIRELNRELEDRVAKRTAELELMQESLLNILAASPVAVVVTPRDDPGIVFCNERYAQLVKTSRDELLGQPARQFIDEEFHQAIDEGHERQGFVSNLEVCQTRPDGRKIWLLVTVVPVTFKDEPAFLTWFFDITARKEVEESLKRQNVLVDLLRQTASDANEAADFEEGAGVCLKSINAYTGWPVGHVYLLSDEDDDLLVPSGIWRVEDKKRFSAIIEVTEKTTFKRGVGLPGRVLESGKAEWIKDVTVDPNFPRARMVDDIGVRGAFAFPVMAEAKVVAVLEFFDEKPSEPDKSLLQTVAHIGSQLGPLYEREKASTGLHEARDAAQEARDVAEEATRAKDMFLAAMSHEIRTPMNGVVGMIELMESTALANDQRRMLETAKDSSFALLTIINDILDFSKIEAGKMEIENIAFDLRKAADAVGDMLGVMAAEKGLPLVVHIQPEVPAMLLGDQVRIRQILFNLAGNAIKFTEHGEVHIGIKVAKTHKDGSVDVVYEIKDSGIGMTEEQIGRLFKPFEQAEASTTRQYGGTGLGLSIVARLIELMGGKVEAESELGKGSTFRVTVLHSVPKVETGEAAVVDLGRMKMLALSRAGSRIELATQLLKENDEGLIDLVAPTTKKAALLKRLAAAEKSGDPYDLVYLSVEVDTNEQDQLRKTIEASKELKNIPRFVVERHNAPITQDIRGSVLIPPTPYTESNLVRALSIVLGKVSPDIFNQIEVKGRAAKVPSLEEAEAAGTLILVAEDNKTNQDVIGRQLAVLGYAHEIADDGAIALDMLSKRAYGLLLSDVHMPNMNGYQLTQAIRTEEKKSRTRLPIVAITANALHGEGDRCMEAGMDAYMAKPMRKKEFRECLKKWVPKVAEEAPSEAETKAVPSAKEGSDDLVVKLDVLIEMFGDDVEILNAILSEFPPAAWEVVAEIESAYDAKDWVVVGAAGHKFKSSARTIGANQLADICGGLEEAGKSGDEKTIKKLMPRLRPAMDAVDAYIRGRD